MGRDRIFTIYELTDLLDAAIGKTLGEVDVNHVFDKTITNPKITGIPGDVVEQSILGMAANSKQEPDIEVDGQLIEIKTTGIRKSKDDLSLYEAKEPVSVTAVSPDKIITETFYESKFWHKIRKILFVYYDYASYSTVLAREYANFYLKGYEIFQFNAYDKRILKKDWELVRDFIISLRQQEGFEEIEYARLSHELRDKLMYIDTAPKWPNPPRFRLKRSLVTSIVQDYFKKKPLETTVNEIISFSELDKICKNCSKNYKNKTIKQLAKEFGIIVKFDKNGNPTKSISEKIVVKMLGGNCEKINSLDVFKKAGIIGKTIVMSPKSKRTEDMKLFTINFDEFEKDLIFENSQFYDYFANHQLLCVVFKETKTGDLLESEFLGFKRLSFDESFINNYVLRIWKLLSDLVINRKIFETICRDKTGNKIINKNGEYKTSLNFPKSSDHQMLFVRGTGRTSSPKDKTLLLNGIKMYQQQVWFRGSDLITLLDNIEYLY